MGKFGLYFILKLQQHKLLILSVYKFFNIESVSSALDAATHLDTASPINIETRLPLIATQS